MLKVFEPETLANVKELADKLESIEIEAEQEQRAYYAARMYFTAAPTPANLWNLGKALQRRNITREALESIRMQFEAAVLSSMPEK